MTKTMYRYFYFIVVICSSARLCASDSTGKNVKDFDFKLNHGQLYTIQISSDGLAYVVGSEPEATLMETDSSVVMECEMSEQRRDYYDSFRPRVASRDKFGETWPVNNVEFYSHFLFIKKEVWRCSDGKQTGLLRIVNEVIGIREAFLIAYTDGVEVFSKSLRQHQNTVLIREIKYIDEYGRAVRYDGSFKLRETKAHPDFFIPDLQSNLRIIPRTEVATDSFKEVTYHDETFEYNKISKTDSTLIVGESISTVYTGSSELGCRRYQGANPFPFTLRPVTKLTVEGKDVIVTKENYLDFFTPIKDEIWACEAPNEDQLLRIVNEFVSQIEIGNVVVHNEVIELRKVKLMRKSGVRIKTVRYYNASAQQNHMTKYEGIIKILDPEDTQMTFLPNYAEQSDSPMKEVVYHLHKERAFKAMVSARGMSVRLGTPWKTIIGEVNDVVTCHKNPKGSFMPEYSTQFRLILRIQEMQFLKALPRSKHVNYWQFIKQEVWMCETSDMKYKFLRIVNELKGLEELHEVEYTDGIQLYNNVLSGNRRSVNVIEIKYINPITFDALMYPGKLILKNSQGSSLKYDFKCFNCDGQPIRKTENSIYFGVGRRKDKFAFDNRVQGVIYKLHKHGFYYDDWDPESSIRILVGYTYSDIVGRIVDLVECIPSNTLRGMNIENYKPEIHKITKGVKLWNFNLKKDEVAELGIEIGRTKAWVCQNSEIKFYRLESTVVFTKPIEQLYFLTGSTITIEKNGKNISRITENFVQYQNFDRILRLRYDGDLVFYPSLDNYDVMCGTVVLEKAMASSVLEREHSIGQEVIYTLDRRRYHKLDVFREYNPAVEKTERKVLVMGEPYKKQIGTANTKAECQIDSDMNSLDFQSRYLTRIAELSNKNNERTKSQISIDQSTVFDNYFKPVNHEKWSCKYVDSDEQEQRFSRIINVFFYNVNDNKLDDIWYSDGISIETGMINNWKVLHISEIRYLDIDDKEVRFDGRIHLKHKIKRLITYRGGKWSERIINTKNTQPEAILFGKASFGVHYELESRLLYKAVLGNMGARLKVGAAYDEVMPSSSYFKTLGCHSYMDEPKFNTISMNIEQGVEDDNSLSKYEVLENPDKFFAITQQIWECKDVNQPERQLYKVINTVEAKETFSIAEVLHYDGVTVHKDGKLITEVKYINPTTGKVVRFDGCIYYNSNPPNPPDLYGNGGAREIFYSLGTELIHIRNLRKDGPVVEMGTRWEEEYAAEGDVKCSLQDQVEFQPLFELRILTTMKGKGDMFVQKEMERAEQGKIFRVKRRDAYRCKRNQENAFIKVVNMLITKVDISTIFHTDGISVWRSESDGNYYIREVKYIDDTRNKVLKYEGRIISKYADKGGRFEEGTSLEEKQARPFNDEEDTDEIWHKEHQQWIANNRKGNEPLERIKYIPYVLSKYIQLSVGLNIRVGSKWMKEVGSSQDTFVCSAAKKNYDEDEILTRIIMFQDYDEILLDKYTMNSYFTIKTTEILECTNGAVSFIRVSTEIVGKNGIRRVSYENGVKVFTQKQNDYLITTHIIELKLMDPSDGYKVVKFEGKLEKTPETISI